MYGEKIYHTAGTKGNSRGTGLIDDTQHKVGGGNCCQGILQTRVVHLLMHRKTNLNSMI